MDTNTQKNLMGAAGAGGAEPGQFMLAGYIHTNGNAITYDWTVPDGVTSICAVAVGGGQVGEEHSSDADGGDGGDLRYVNDIPVTPGETLQIGVAPGMAGYASNMDTSHSAMGKPSWLSRGEISGQDQDEGSGTALVMAIGGETRTFPSSNRDTDGVGTGTDGYAGIDGGNNDSGNGGAAGGYTNSDRPHATTGVDSKTGKTGAGIGLTGGLEGQGTNTNNQRWGSGGAPEGDPLYIGHYRGMYGGGSGGLWDTDIDSVHESSLCGPGAVRIIWGEGRSFPNNAGGYFPKATGKELEIRFMDPIYYMKNDDGAGLGYTPGYHTNGKNYISGLEIFDDNGTNLCWPAGYDTDNASHDMDNMVLIGQPIAGQSNNPIYGGDLDNTSSGYVFDFSDLGDDEGTWNLGGTATSTGHSQSLFPLYKWLDTDENDTNNFVYTGWIQGSKDRTLTDTDGYLTGDDHWNNYYNHNILFKFGSNKTIGKIHFYIRNQKAWLPRMQILLDGNVIADDAAHFIPIDTDAGHNSIYDDGNYRLAVFEFT